MVRGTKWIFCIGAVVALFTNIARSQDYRGRVQGTISDASQAVVAGAKVTLTNVNTGAVKTEQSNSSGHYFFELVEPGSYTVVVEAAGFAKFIRDNVSVPKEGDVTVDAALKTGSLQETVEVKGETATVEFNSSSLETTVDSVQTNRMPQIYRSPFLLAQMDPAVIPDGNGDWNPFNSWGPVSMSVGGGGTAQSDLQVDGAPTGIGIKNSYQPVMESVDEVSVQQNTVDAEYGHSSGSAITMTTKSGTNSFHGVAYYQGQYPWANAMENRLYPDSGPDTDRKQIFGGTLGNPIVKNKLFNFFAMEDWKYDQPGQYTETVPTPAERTGDYSQALNGAGGQLTIYNPWTSVVTTNANVTRTPFPNNVIPSSLIDPIAAKYTSMLWAPSSAGQGPLHTNDYEINLPVQYPYRNISDKVDYNVTDKLHVDGRLGIIRVTSTVGNPTGSPIFQNDRGSLRDSTQYMGSATYTINPTTVLTLRGDYHSFIDASYYVQAANAPTFATIWPNDPFYKPVYADPGIPQLVPRMSVDGETQMGAQNGWWRQTPNGETTSGQVGHQAGNHYLKFGGEFRLAQVKSALTGENPGFGFDAGPTSSTSVNAYNGPTNVSGDSYATFLLGIVAPVNAGNQGCWACGSTAMPINIFPNTEAKYAAAFVNDDWKISKNLTLTLGLRYEHQGPYYEPDGRMTAPLNLNVANSIVSGHGIAMPSAVSQYYSGPWNLNGAYQFTSQASAWNNNIGSVSPRIGMAYRLNDKTSLRAGWGRFYTPWGSIESYEMEGANYYGYSVTSGVPNLLNGVPQMTLSNPYPSTFPLTPATGDSLGANTGLGDSISFMNPNRPMQHSDRFDFSVQRELPQNILVDVTFFMNLTNQVCDDDYVALCNTTKNLDMMDPNLSELDQNALNTTIKNPFYGLNMMGPLATYQQVSIGSLMVPYPQYLGINEVDGNLGSDMHYQSLQIKLQKRFSQGYSFLFAYNYHREQRQVYYDNFAQYADNWTWTDGGLPRTRFTISGSWELPFGKGRPFLTDANRVADAVIGGWVATGLLTYQSGAPINFSNLVVTGNPDQNIPIGNNYYFNPASIATLPAYTIPESPWYFPGVNGPHFFNVDASIMKEFRITPERVKFSLRMDAFNALNNFNWGGVNVSPGNASVNGTSNSIATNTRGRVLQLGLRLAF